MSQVAPIHAGIVRHTFDVVHLGQIVTFVAGQLIGVDARMKDTIDMSDGEVEWDQVQNMPAPSPGLTARPAAIAAGEPETFSPPAADLVDTAIQRGRRRQS